VSESTTEMTAVMIDPVTGEIIDQKELAERLLAQAKEQGVSLVGPGGLLNQLTRNVLETALEVELTEHLGHEHGQTQIAANMRNGTRSKTVLTEIGPVEIEVPRDRDGSFEPVIVPKRKRRLDGIDQIVLSLFARGLPTGEIAAHFEEVYGAKVSKDTISRITEKVVGELAEWSARPLDPVHPVLFVDAIVVKVRDGQLRTTPFYVVMGVTVNGEREILGIWAGDGGEGARFWLQVFAELKDRGVEDVLIAVCDGLKGTWERTVVQQCIVHLIRNSFRYAGRRHRDGIVKALKPVYTAGPSKRRRTGRRVHGRVGPAISGNRPALGVILGGIRAVPGVRRRDTAGDLHDERNRVDQRPLPQGCEGPWALSKRGRRPEMPVSGKQVS
jgi:putative transposase